jgi:pimeloyl-ACP methyl ester carboxylesterase
MLGYSLGGMVAQEIALERPSLVHKMLLVGTARRQAARTSCTWKDSHIPHGSSRNTAERVQKGPEYCPGPIVCRTIDN